MATRRVDANEQLPFKTISVAAEKIAQRLENDKSDDQKNDETTQEEDAESHRRYVEQRVRETAMWERRINPQD